ncbi:ABC transporter permease [Desulfobacter latus]|uniref:Proline/glycine betaine ABC transporter permease n=1 Tax=Desulfobacter latus TaxID=2292 RepID=A0A850TAW4_9BACT|nr:proline/glycine betaine ABC transporter permease [Desulfobacter latus]NWH06545.1 proline/glycine betaine ABC transporter permease [Desulfobacter latus]
MFDEKVLPIDMWITDFVDWLVNNYRHIFQIIKWPVEQILTGFDIGLNAVPPIIIIGILTFCAWRFSGWALAVFSIIAMIFIGLIGFWADTMTTLAMVLASVFFSTIVGVPVGIAAGRSDRVETIIRPFLDAMQTTPSFVYLVPIVMLFSVGNVAGVLATIIFAMPPIIRLTSLGIRGVHRELVEAAKAFGATRKQVLFKVQIPLAMPTILAGLNQTIMMALAMVVIAALIGAGGLGSPVIQGLNTLDIGLAVMAGLSIVLVAVLLDRITQSMAGKN